MIGTLNASMLRSLLFLLCICLGVGTVLYLLSETFDRVDEFLEAGAGTLVLLRYLAVKVPLILSQIVPPVMLIACIIHQSMMAENRELTALFSGGIAPVRIARFFVFFAAFFCLFHFGFSQLLGIYGEREAERIMQVEVKGKAADDRFIYNRWFKEGNTVVEVVQINAVTGDCRKLTILELDPETSRIASVLTAERALAKPGSWTLHGVQRIDPEDMRPGAVGVEKLDSLEMPFKQDPGDFLAFHSRTDPTSLTLDELRHLITTLEASGSDVRGLETAKHMKFSFAFSAVPMVLTALAVISITSNIYISVGAGLLLSFLYYATLLMGVSAGERGVLSPFAAAWAANVIFLVLASGRLAWAWSPRRRKSLRRSQAPQPA
jgi:lipopolysaccharide export system permease protein